MRRILLFCLVVLLVASPCMAARKSVSELRLIAQAGASLIVDIDRDNYSVTELVVIASSLSHGATLTIKTQDGSAFSTAQYAQIAKAKPGQVCFWF